MQSLKNKRVTVMGLGRFGGGVGVTRWLSASEARVLITDTAPADQLVDSVRDIIDLITDGRVVPRLGQHNLADFTDTDLVIANPAVPKPWANQYLLAAEKAGVPITTEIGLLIERLPAREQVIAITGSVGKSTTTAMVANAIAATGNPVVLGGNIGGTLLHDLEDITPDTHVILELSSAMLYWLGRTLKWSPGIAVCTNLAANHMDWHETLEHYESSKRQILRHQTSSDTAILSPGVAHWKSDTPARIVIAADPPRDMRLAIPGSHNRINAAMALAACIAAAPDVAPAEFLARLQTFPGLPHRLQLAQQHNGRRFYNDSKCTTPEALTQALNALSEDTPGDTSRIHLIAGGYDKKVSLSPVAALAPRLAGLYCIGKTGPAIFAEAHPLAPSRVFSGTTLDDAVQAAIPRMKPGDSLLLSPACASWDQYPNYEHRGQHFIDLVTKATVPATAMPTAGAKI